MCDCGFQSERHSDRCGFDKFDDFRIVEFLCDDDDAVHVEISGQLKVGHIFVRPFA